MDFGEKKKNKKKSHTEDWSNDMNKLHLYIFIVIIFDNIYTVCVP